jgi:hypothetical protein
MASATAILGEPQRLTMGPIAPRLIRPASISAAMGSEEQPTVSREPFLHGGYALMKSLKALAFRSSGKRIAATDPGRIPLSSMWQTRDYPAELQGSKISCPSGGAFAQRVEHPTTISARLRRAPQQPTAQNQQRSSGGAAPHGPNLGKGQKKA